jgi:hypothetical protein
MDDISIRVETLETPFRYTPEQIQRAVRIAERLRRGPLVLCEEPGGDTPPA